MRAQNRLTPSCDSFHLPAAKAASVFRFTVWASAAGGKTNRRNKHIKTTANLIIMCAPFRIYSGRPFLLSVLSPFEPPSCPRHHPDIPPSHVEPIGVAHSVIGFPQIYS